MKLLNANYGIEFELNENEVNVLVVENPAVLSSIISELYKQSNGQDGNFVLSDKEKLFKFGKEIALVLEPFSINCNERRIVTKLYQELKTQIDEYMIEETVQLYSKIVDYLDKVTQKVPYLTTFQLDFDITGLFKLLDVELESSDYSLCENIIAYMKALAQLCGYQIMIFLNLKMFLSIEEIMSLYEFAFYNKIDLILIESTMHTTLQTEKTCIIDKDMCVIYY